MLIAVKVLYKTQAVAFDDSAFEANEGQNGGVRSQVNLGAGFSVLLLGGRHHVRGRLLPESRQKCAQDREEKQEQLGRHVREVLPEGFEVGAENRKEGIDLGEGLFKMHLVLYSSCGDVIYFVQFY